jgi:hypothetical protein
MRPVLATFLRNPTPFTGLTTLQRPSKVALVQTDGSFSSQYPEISRSAVILRTKDGIDYSLVDTYTDHWNSHETEWVSVLNGIRFALKKDQGSVELENDCLPVIKHLINKRVPLKSYLADYYSQIFKEARVMEYLGIRWIPRELNKADELFRI